MFTLHSPLVCRLVVHFDHRGCWSLHALLVQHHRGFHVEEVVPPPFELDSLDFGRIILVLLFDSDVDVPEGFGDKSLYSVPLIHHEA